VPELYGFSTQFTTPAVPVAVDGGVPLNRVHSWAVVSALWVAVATHPVVLPAALKVPQVSYKNLLAPDAMHDFECFVNGRSHNDSPLSVAALPCCHASKTLSPRLRRTAIK
jgi:hypothetical protein